MPLICPNKLVVASVVCFHAFSIRENERPISFCAIQTESEHGAQVCTLHPATSFSSQKLPV